MLNLVKYLWCVLVLGKKPHEHKYTKWEIISKTVVEHGPSMFEEETTYGWELKYGCFCHGCGNHKIQYDHGPDDFKSASAASDDMELQIGFIHKVTG